MFLSRSGGLVAAGAGGLRRLTAGKHARRPRALAQALGAQQQFLQAWRGKSTLADDELSLPSSSSCPAYAAEDDPPVSFEDVSTAMYRIRNGIVRTPCYRSHFLSELCGTNIYVKNEFSQFTGSFKERGARNALLLLTEEEKRRGVMAASAGNHALALSWHGSQLGIPVHVFMPVVAPLAKVDKCRRFGANVVITGQHIGEAKDFAMSNPDYNGIKYINGYDDPEIVAGAGTLGIEVLEQLATADYVVVPVGGAGLLAGVSLAVKTLKPDCKVIGVEPKNCRSFEAALRHGKPVTADVRGTLADGLAVPMVGPTAFEVARRFTDDVVFVDEKMIALAMLRLLENERCVVEGGGATGLAALLPGGPLDLPEYKNKNVVVLLCGGNIDITMLGRVIDRGLAADGRLIRFIATVSDRPGGIAALTKHIAAAGASIKDIIHERSWLYHSVDQVNVKCIVETMGREHSQQLREHLLAEGYELAWDLTGLGTEATSDEKEN